MHIITYFVQEFVDVPSLVDYHKEEPIVLVGAGKNAEKGGHVCLTDW
jgi:hypothetical protein